MRTLALALALAAASCSNDPAPSDVPTASDAADVIATDIPSAGDVVDAGGAQACTAGRIEECPCGDGRRGMQTCQPSGSYGPCVCADAGSPMDVVVATDVVDVVAPRDAVDVVDVGICPNGRTAICDGVMVSLVNGVRDDAGIRHHCGACGVSCALGEGCVSCRCER